MEIREATAQDWPAIYPFFSAIVAEGETYAYPEHLSLEQARAYWMATAARANGGGARR